MAGVCRGGICLDKWLYDALTVCTSNQSIAEAKNRLSELIDRALPVQRPR